jgi:hypothetical protein
MNSNQYHVFTKSETSSKYIEHAVASSLTGPYSFVQTGNFAGWGRAEGPSITQLPSGSYRLYVAHGSWLLPGFLCLANGL